MIFERFGRAGVGAAARARAREPGADGDDERARRGAREGALRAGPRARGALERPPRKLCETKCDIIQQL